MSAPSEPNGLLPEACLHELVRAQAERTPRTPALSIEGEVLTYGELEERSNRLARHFGSLGVGPDTFVAVAVDRSFELVVALLGVLKAGGAYLPIDPAYPAERVASCCPTRGSGSCSPSPI